MTRNLVNFHAGSQKSGNLHFNGLLLSNAYKVLDEKVQESYVSWHWRMTQSFKKNWILVPEMTWGISWILMWEAASRQICTLICYFCWKYITFEPKQKYREVKCHNTAEWCKIWGGTNLNFEKWHEEFGDIELINLTQHSKVSKFGIYCPPFEQNICLNYKVTGELCVMTLKGDAIFKEKLTDGLKNEIRDLINFHASSCNLINFHASNCKSENLQFDRFRFVKCI